MTSLLGEYDRSRLPVWIAAIVLGLALAFVVWQYIGTFVLGLFVYYITRPIHRRVVKVVRQPSLTAGVSLLVIALPVILLVGYTVYVGAFQLAALAKDANLQPVLDALKPYIGDAGGTAVANTNLQDIFSSIVNNPQEFLSGGVVETLEKALAPVLGYLGAFGTALIQLFVVLALAFYLLRDDQKFAAWFHAQISGENTPVSSYLAAVDHNLKTIYFGNILNAFVTAILAAIFYNLLNTISPAGVAIPSPTLLGMLTGVGSLIPVVGMKIVYIPVALILAVEAALLNPALLWFPVVFAAVSLVIVDTIPDLILRPYVSGRDLHTGAVMIAYIIGPLLFGWYGLFLGPLILVLVIHFARILLPELIRGEPLTPGATAGNPLNPNDTISVFEPESIDPEGSPTSDGAESTTDGESDQSSDASDTDD